MSPDVKLPSMTTSIPQHVDLSSSQQTPSHTLGEMQENGGSSPSAADYKSSNVGQKGQGKDLRPDDESKTKIGYRVEFRDEDRRILEIKTIRSSVRTPIDASRSSSMGDFRYANRSS